ncbi:hypothetical protein BGX28_003195 [Mortierella sp. GBA30]|nr:hypothetical protein BGX28_003195 [Mortierella sp. GBA30]
MGSLQNIGVVDPIVTREMYRSELASLTFNSKPIITSLTIAAGENISAAKVIVQTIEERLRTAPPNQKLPTLYLIDSIIKNVGGRYLSLFGRTIVNMFLEAYAVVDSSAKASFEKVLGTWPNWTSQLFPRDIIVKIERGVQMMRQQQQYSQYQPSGMHVNPHFSDRARDPRDPREEAFKQGPSNMYGSNGSAAPEHHLPLPAAPQSVEPSADTVLLRDIQLLMLQKQQAMILNPHDQSSAKQVAILQQLETIVKTTQLTPDHANMIRQQLAQLWTPVPAPVPVPPVAPGFASAGVSQAMPALSSPMPSNMMMIPPGPTSIPPHLQQPPILPPNPVAAVAGIFAPHLLPQGSVPSPQPTMATLPPASMPARANLPISGVPPMSTPMSIPPMPPMSMNTATLAPPAPVAPPAPSVVPAAASDLFASLMQSGLLGPNGTLTNQLLQNTAGLNLVTPQSPLVPPISAAATATPPPMASNVVAHDRFDQSELDHSVMSLGLIELTSQDIQRRRPAAIQVMYGVPPLQCNQCGYRCPKSADAQKKMDAHLDWHFRQNRRMKDKAKKSHSRSWLVGQEDWIHSREGDLTQSQQPVFFDFGSGVSKTSKDEQALQEEIAALKEQIVSVSSLIQNLRGAESDTITMAMAENTIAKGCSVCKEKFIKVWNEAEEEWSYKNATVVDKMIYHATCHADLVRSNQRQAALAAAAATATASATSTPTPSVDSPESSSTDAAAPLSSAEPTKAQVDANTDIVQDEKDVKMELKTEETAAPLTEVDQEMSEPPSSLKRKIEYDQEEENQVATKRAILDQA